MKRVTALLCTLCLFLLCACGRSSAPFSADLVDKLLEHEVFSEPLELLEPEIARFLYQLDPEQSGLTELRAYRSSGATCEEAAVLIFQTEDDADSALPVLQAYLTARILSCRDYMPDQVPKLEHAILTQRSNTILLVVADNWTGAANLTE
ncbi:MAG: DUF4358 domain-containing protein [Oscillospiraceae bacterium]|nr:DUF4358 domain-containing protein [Oscillospiraceae bacterium]